MKKRLSVALFVFFSVAAVLTADVADEKKLLNMVPASASAVVSVNASEWLTLPVVKKSLAESREMAEAARLTGVSPSDISAAVFWMKDGGMALLTLWKAPFDPAKVFIAPAFTCSKMQKEGLTLYYVKSAAPPVRKKKKRAAPRPRSFYVAHLAGGVTGIFTSPEFAVEAVKLSKQGKRFAFPASLAGSLRAVASRGRLPCEFSLSCRMVGKNRGDLSAFIACECDTPEQAENFKAQAMLTLNLMLVQGMQKRPELASELIKSFKFDTSGKKATLSVYLPEKILSQLGEFAAQSAAARKSMKNTKKTLPPKNVRSK